MSAESFGTWTPDDPRCPICIGPVGDDSRRCERDALPLHRTHLVDGIYHLPINTDDLNDALERKLIEAEKEEDSHE